MFETQKRRGRTYKGSIASEKNEQGRRKSKFEQTNVKLNVKVTFWLKLMPRNDRHLEFALQSPSGEHRGGKGVMGPELRKLSDVHTGDSILCASEFSAVNLRFT